MEHSQCRVDAICVHTHQSDDFTIAPSTAIASNAWNNIWCHARSGLFAPFLCMGLFQDVIPSCPEVCRPISLVRFTLLVFNGPASSFCTAGQLYRLREDHIDEHSSALATHHHSSKEELTIPEALQKLHA